MGTSLSHQCAPLIELTLWSPFFLLLANWNLAFLALTLLTELTELFALWLIIPFLRSAQLELDCVYVCFGASLFGKSFLIDGHWRSENHENGEGRFNSILLLCFFRFLFCTFSLTDQLTVSMNENEEREGRTCEWMIPLAPHSLTHYFLLIESKVHTVTVCLHAFAARWLVSAGEKEKESWLDRDRSPKLLGSSRRSCSMTSSSFSSFPLLTLSFFFL